MLYLEILRGTTIAAEIGQAVVDLTLEVKRKWQVINDIREHLNAKLRASIPFPNFDWIFTFLILTGRFFI